MNKVILGLLLSFGMIGVSKADAGSYDYSTNIFGGGSAGWYADTMAQQALFNNQQGNSPNNYKLNATYEERDDPEGYSDTAINNEKNCDCEEDY